MTMITQQDVQASGSFEIVYDRSDKVYQVTTPAGDVVGTFPAKAKGAALQFAIGLFEPALFEAVNRMIDRNPQLERAAWKGAELVIANGVEIFDVPVNNCFGMVASSDGIGRYAILSTAAGFECGCEHFTLGEPPTATVGGREQRFCKHIAGMFLSALARRNG